MDHHPIWGRTTDVSGKLEEGGTREERELRSLALEKTYVHDVYQEIACHFTSTRYRAWPRVKQFLLDLDPGSIVCDVGCGNGKHMDVNPYLFKMGVDRCSNLANATREKAHEVLIADNLALPFRDDCVDAVLSVAVIHHFSTASRRVDALRELTRVLRIGGKILVSVWAMEQRHRKFESQDVLVPWNQPVMSSSDDKTSSIERDLNSTTTTSDDDATHYHAYTQTSDSDSFPSLRHFRKRVRLRHRGQSIDPAACSSQSSSDLSSPNESCYTFVRKAIQKLARSKRTRVGRGAWFLHGLGLGDQDDLIEPLASMDEDAGEELKEGEEDLWSSNLSEFFRLGERSSIAQRGLIFSNLLSTRRRRTLETTRELEHPTPHQIAAHPKSKSLSDLLGMIPMGFFRSPGKRSQDTPLVQAQAVPEAASIPPEENLEHPTSSFLKLEFDLSEDEVEFPEYVSHKAVQTEGFESLSLGSSSFESKASSLVGHHKGVPTVSNSPEIHPGPSKACGPTRPTLVKQKESISSPFVSFDFTFDGEKRESPIGSGTKSEVSWGEIKTSVKNLPEFKQSLHPVLALTKPTSSLRGRHLGPSVWKQSSLNEDLIFSERLREKERLKQNIQKQCSLNEEFINKERENTRWDQMKEAFLNPSNVKCIQLLKNGISNRFRGYETPSTSSPMTTTSSRFPTPPPPAKPQQPTPTNSIRSGLVRILQNWKQSESTPSTDSTVISGTSSIFVGSRPGITRRGLFPPFFLRRSSAGSLNVTKKDLGETSPFKLLSPPPYLSRRPSENDLLHESRLCGSGGAGNKLTPGVRHVRKLSREDGSDSSKDSSFQSDTSVDSEDSFASVIFIPKGSENEVFGSETRANSTDSDRSPKSPALRLSPPNYSSTPKSPSPLATELGRRRSPEISPTRMGLIGTPFERRNKFVFDENSYAATQVLPTTLLPAAATSESPNFNTSPVVPESIPMDFPTERSAVVPVPQPEVIPKIILAPPPILSEVDSLPEAGALPQTGIGGHQSPNQEALPKKQVEQGDVPTKPVGVPRNKGDITRKLVRRSIPMALAAELYNPETDDADTSESSSSSPNSVSSVVSVVTEDSAALQQRRETEENKGGTGDKVEEAEKPRKVESPVQLTVDQMTKDIRTPSVSRDSSLGRGIGSFESSDSLESHTNSSKRKLTLARLGNTTEWLSSIPSDMMDPGTSQSGSSSACHSKDSSSGVDHHSRVNRRSSILERHPGEKMLLGEVKKLHQKGPDVKWPSCLIDESPPQTAGGVKGEEEDRGGPVTAPSLEQAERLLEELEERDSLFDSIENLTSSRQEPSRNPSFDSSLRLSSNCSCSIRGGDSFESYCSSAKSSFTNSSSHRNSASFVPPCPPGPNFGNSPNSRRRRGQADQMSKSSSVAGEDTEDSAGQTYHRYYHVFREGELDKLIEKYVQNLHIISSYYDKANWCIIAEKVQVWTI